MFGNVAPSQLGLHILLWTAQLVNNADELVLEFFFKTSYVSSFESSEISAHENDNAYGKEHMVIVGLKRYVAKHYTGMSLVSRRMIS